MITVLKSDKSGDKEAVLVRIPSSLMRQLDEVIQGDRAPALVKLIEIGLKTHKDSGDNIVINVEPPKRGRAVKPGEVVTENGELAKDLSKLMAPTAGFGRKGK